MLISTLRSVALSCLATICISKSCDGSLHEFSAPTSWAYVSADPLGNADQLANSLEAAKAKPFVSIQDAVAIAQPGTAIIVQSGTFEEPLIYEGQVHFGPENSGTREQPIYLVAETYRGARIMSPKVGEGDITTVLFANAHDVEIHNFQIVSQPEKPADNTTVKVVNTPSSRIEPNRIRIAGNHMSGKGCDGMKAGSSREVEIYGNYLEGSDGYTESAIDCVGALYHKIKWNTVRGLWKEGPAFKGGAMGMEFSYNDVEIQGHAKENAVALLVGELGYSRWKRPMPFGGETWRWAETQDIDVRHNRLVTNFRHALWLRGSTNASFVGNFFSSRSETEYARFLNSRSGLWRDQSETPPEAYAPYAFPFEDPGDRSKRRITYHNRNHTIVNNWIAEGTGRAIAIEEDQDNCHRLEAPKVAKSAADVIEGPFGQDGWDQQAIYQKLGLNP